MKLFIILAALGKEGISNSVVTYFENMNRSGLEITVGVAGDIDPDMMTRLSKIGISLYPLVNRSKKPFSYFFQLVNVLKKNHVDVLHVHGNSASLAIDLLAGKLANIPIRIAHSRNSSCTHLILDKLMRPFFNLLYTDAFAVSKEAGRWLFGKRKFLIVPNGKDLNKFAFNEEIRNEIRFGNGVSDKIIVGHVGAFNKQKNHVFLLDIFKCLLADSDKYELWLFGADDGERENIINLIKKNELQNHIKVFDYRNDIQHYLNAMDVMVFPSLYEGLPNVVIEWQINGLTCFLSDSITKDCKVLDSVHFIPLTKSPGYWADQILHFSYNRSLYSKTEIFRRMQLANFDIKTNAEFLKNKYEELYSLHVR